MKQVQEPISTVTDSLMCDSYLIIVALAFAQWRRRTLRGVKRGRSRGKLILRPCGSERSSIAYIKTSERI